MIDLLDLPFDQYGRHRIALRVADSVRAAHQLGALDVLDVGGYPCLTPRFLPHDRVTTVDIIQPSEPIPAARYLRADGAALPFADGSFDLVISLDSLEHVAQDRRQAYVSELLRASRRYVLLVAPFEQQETVLAERVLAEFVRVVNQEEQPQLREHRDFGLPDLEEWLAFFRSRGLECVSFSSGFVYNWLPMMLLKHYVMSLPNSDALHGAVDRLYNSTLQESDAREPGYRHGILVSKEPSPRALDQAREALAPRGGPDRLELIERMEHLGLLLKLADLHLSSRQDDRLREEVLAKERHILNIEAALASKEQHIHDLAAMLEAEQNARKAVEAELLAVRKGRVMRLLAAINQLVGRSS